MNYLKNLNKIDYKFYLKNSDVLLIWFGGLGEPFLSEKFSDLSGYDCLCFRDGRNDWYSGGISGEIGGERKLLNILKNIRRRYKFVCTAGQSSGGYASLYYGIKAHVNLCISFSPQTKNVYNGEGVMAPCVYIDDIDKLYCRTRMKPLVFLNIGRSENQHASSYVWNDREQISSLRTRDSVTTIEHPFDVHAITLKLREEGIFYDFIINIIKLSLVRMNKNLAK